MITQSASDAECMRSGAVETVGKFRLCKIIVSLELGKNLLIDCCHAGCTFFIKKKMKLAADVCRLMVN